VIRLRTLNATAAVAACFALAACGGGTKTAEIPSGSASDNTGTSATVETTPTTTTLSSPTPEVKRLAGAVGTSPKKRPKIVTPKGTPPTKLIADDIVVGKGPAAKTGDALTVDYVGANWSNGKVFDESWKRKQTFPVTLGQGVIQGWSDGLVGAKAGGRRMLVIPPDLGYGANGSPPSIGPNETLIFVIDVRKIG